MSTEPYLPANREETQAAAILDAYVNALRAGQSAEQAALRAEHRELVTAFDCLDELDALAHAATEVPPPEAPTLPPEGGATSAQAGEPPVGFGQYELLGTLGRGGMGVVYKARQKKLDRIVALKMILASQFASAEQVQRFHTEARAAAGLRHPHILQIYEAGLVLGQHYFAMQYVPGQSLAECLRKGMLAAEEAARCLLAVARAVGYLHQRGIVHRDLKPSNILLDEQGWPYVTDFGLVKSQVADRELTGSGAIVGTPSYMAPEQAAGRNAEVGPLSDVYSLGAILYEALTGRPPFQATTPLDTLVQVLEGEPVLPRTLNPKVPRDLELICLKALAKAPEQRYHSAEALAGDLERFLSGEPVLARPQSPLHRLVRWTRQEPGLISRLAVLAVCALISQIYYHFAHPVPLAQHIAIMSVLGVWAVVSVVCQTLLRHDWNPEAIRLVWLGADALLLTMALILDEAYTSPLVLGYGLFIVASGLWFRVGLVWFTTAMALAGYLLLIVIGALQSGLGVSPQHHLIVWIGLAALGAMVAAQVRRVRALSRYYEHRPLP
jgi:serine/threonine-protein kinase